jgi:16S rRNA (cytosine967-C5)-methyltransferase
MPASPARAAALDILVAVESKDAFASELLHSERVRHLSPEDHGLCTELVMGTLRWQSALDGVIAQFASQKISKLDAEVRMALRLAAYQMAFTRVPARAAVNESVELVKRARKRSAVPFVNAVLRKMSANSLEIGKASGVAAEDLASAYAHPEWLVARWVGEFGAEIAAKICEFNQQVPVTAVRLRDASVEAALKGEGVELAPGALMRSARRVVSGDVTRTKVFAEGKIAIQDEGSQLVAALVGRGSRLLDCCAAPGGKTAVLAESNPEATIVAAELHPHRARLLRERVTANYVEVLTGDAAKLPLGADFDRVLADVPCSGTGTLGRNPEIKWKLKQEDLADLHARQVAILRGAMSHVAPGGRIVYSSCSLEPEENEAVVDEVMAEMSEFGVVECREELERLQGEGELVWGEVGTLLRGPFVRTIQGVHPCDGFFAAVMERKG